MSLTMCTSPATSPGAERAGAPGKIWGERITLGPETQTLMNSSPLMKIENGELKLDMGVLQRIQNDDNKSILDRFRSSLAKINMKECYTSPLRPTKSMNGVVDTSTVVSRKRQRLEEDEAPSSTQSFMSFFPPEKWKSFRMVTKKPKLNTEPDQETDVEEDKDEKSHVMSMLSNEDQAVCVPFGASSKDRLTTWDKTNKMLTRAYYDIPDNAYEGMKTKFRLSQKKFKILMVDGDGFKVGGNTTAQHAVRLNLHRRMCTNSTCMVLGCGSDPAYSVFKNAADPSIQKEYNRHWNLCNKRGLKVHGHVVRSRADVLRR